MFNLDREPLFSGQPMSFEDLLEEELQLEGLENMHILTVEEVREGLSRVGRELATLQSLVDEAHDMTEEIEILLDRYAPEHPHVVEMAELLGSLWSGAWPQGDTKLCFCVACMSRLELRV